MKISAPGLKTTILPWGEEFQARLTEIGSLRQGWDGGTAFAPNETAQGIACRYLEELIERGEEPARLGPAGFGGIAFVHERADKEVYVGISNKGEIYALFMDEGEVPDPLPFAPDPSGYKALIEKIRAHLG